MSWDGRRSAVHPLHVQPAGERQVSLRSMQVSPQAYPVRHTRQQAAVGPSESLQPVRGGPPSARPRGKRAIIRLTKKAHGRLEGEGGAKQRAILSGDTRRRQPQRSRGMYLFLPDAVMTKQPPRGPRCGPDGPVAGAVGRGPCLGVARNPIVLALGGVTSGRAPPAGASRVPSSPPQRATPPWREQAPRRVAACDSEPSRQTAVTWRAGCDDWASIWVPRLSRPPTTAEASAMLRSPRRTAADQATSVPALAGPRGPRPGAHQR